MDVFNASKWEVTDDTGEGDKRKKNMVVYLTGDKGLFWGEGTDSS